MGYKRKLVAATSDPYPDGTIRPPEELEAAVKRRRHVPLTLGHPPSIIGADGKPKPGPVPEHLLLGDVEYSYDKEGKRKIANTTFFTEYFHRLPKYMQDKVVNFDPLPLSEGFEHGWRDEKTIIDIMPHHLGVLVDKEPLCPLTACGVNVRMESGSSYRYEQRAEATEDELKMSKEPEPDPVEGLRQDVKKLTEMFLESIKPKEEPKEPVVVEHEVVQEPPQEEPEPVRAPAPVEPVREPIPASVPVPDDFERDPLTGGIVFSGKPHDRSKKK